MLWFGHFICILNLAIQAKKNKVNKDIDICSVFCKSTRHIFTKVQSVFMSYFPCCVEFAVH